jgi:hypothetical protein
LRDWEQDLEKDRRGDFKHKDRELIKQLQVAEKHNEKLSDEIKYPKYEVHKGASYHSKLLPTKEITRLLQQCDSGLLDLTIATQQLTIQEDTREQSSLQAQIQIPPKQD